jgi:hypothetical protein
VLIHTVVITLARTQVQATMIMTMVLLLPAPLPIALLGMVIIITTPATQPANVVWPSMPMVVVAMITLINDNESPTVTHAAMVLATHHRMRVHLLAPMITTSTRPTTTSMTTMTMSTTTMTTSTHQKKNVNDRSQSFMIATTRRRIAAKMTMTMMAMPTIMHIAMHPHHPLQRRVAANVRRVSVACITARVVLGLLMSQHRQ